MAAKTRTQLLADIADQYGNYISLTITSGSTTTIIDTGDLYQPDDYWINHYAYVLTDADGASAAPEGEERPVTDHDQTSATATVAPAFTAALAVGDTVEILPLQRSVLERAINNSVVAAGETWPVMTVDITTITKAADDYDYTLPTDVVRLLSVWYRDVATEPFIRLDGHWRVTGTPGAQELHLDSLAGLNDGDTLRLEYLERPSTFTADTGTLGIGEPAETGMLDFIIEYALAWLHRRAASSQGGGDFREHLTLAKQHLERADMLKKGATQFHGAGTVRQNRWARAVG